MGPSAKAPFDVDAGLARRMLAAPNPDGRPNADVVRPVASGVDLVQRSRGKWTIDFGVMSEQEAALYEMPFEYVKKTVVPVRLERRDDYRGQWWQYARPRPEMREALDGKRRFLATAALSKHRIFVWAEPRTLCNQQTLVFAREDDYFFGVLHSRIHRVWALAQGTQLESRPRYTPTTCFETFPFPNAAKEQSEAIAEAARELDRLREGWLNPAPVGGLPMTKEELKKRTLTNLYNERPTWLVNAHAGLDAAVLAAYGWPADISDADMLSRLLALNLEREPA